MTALRIDNLSLSIGERRVLQGISVRVDPGEIVGVVGESGSGKSLTAASAIGFLPRSAHSRIGTVQVSGTDPFTLDQKALRQFRREKAALIFQDPMTALNPTRRVGHQFIDLMEEGGAPAREKAIAMFTRMQLPDPERTFRAYPFELSGGQRQRALIAMSLVRRPTIVLADEITTALDVSLRDDIMTLLLSEVERIGAGALVISHDLAMIGRFCSRVYVMAAGRVIEEGPAAQILQAPREEYTLRLLAARPENARPFTRLCAVDEAL